MQAIFADRYGLRLDLSLAGRLGFAAVLILLPGLLLVAVAFQPWVDPRWMFLDTLAAAQNAETCCSVTFGAMSNLGIFLWVGTASIALFSALIFALNGIRGDWIRFALICGTLTGWLALDDAYLLHEVVLPRLGVAQLVVVSLYVVLTLAYIAICWRIVLSSEIWILGLAGMGGGTSLAIDQVVHSLDSAVVVMEDSAKFFGIVCWAVFHILTLALMHRSNNAQARPEQGCAAHSEAS